MIPVGDPLKPLQEKIWSNCVNICKVCERGQLSPKKIFRMSGPVVTIGFILLVPSVLGKLAATLMFFRVIAYNGNESSGTTTERLNPAVSALPQPQDSQPSWDLQSDNEFRRACAVGVTESQRESNKFPTLPAVVQTCECTLDASEAANDFSSDTIKASAGLCALRWLREDVGMPDEKRKIPYLQVYKSYTDPLGYQDALARQKNTEQQASPTSLTWFHLLGSTFAIVLGIVSFVGGLLGWLLVMKKRVLQCSVCSATVSAC
jgi:hypothetical protein